MRQKLILDVDTGTDDAIALMLAALSPELDLIGVTAVNGNVEVAVGANNSLRVLDHVGRPDITVYVGADHPLVRPDFPVPRGSDGRSNAMHGRFLPLPESNRHVAERNAVDFLIETYRGATDPITLVAVAPLTNLAMALEREPRFAGMVPELLIMGGGYALGNATPVAEFNIWADPEAAARVLSAGFRSVTLVPLDATHQALITRADCDRFAATGSAAGVAAAALIGQRIAAHDKHQQLQMPNAAPVHDAVCIASLLDPDIVRRTPCRISVDTSQTAMLGRTVIELGSHAHSNCVVCLEADAGRFARTMAAVLAAGPSSSPQPNRSHS